MISIVMPCYNRASFLQRALDNISAQSLKDLEVVIVDDGSTDDTREMIESIRSNYIFSISYFFQHNQGAAAARQTGVKHSKGQFIAFFDSDDLWAESYLKSLQDVMLRNEFDWVYCPIERRSLGDNKLKVPNSFYVNNKPRAFVTFSEKLEHNVFKLDFERSIEEQLESGLFMGFQNTLFNKNVFDRIVIPNIRIGEDRLMALMLLKNRLRGGFITDVLVSVFEHESNTTSSGKENHHKIKATYLELILGYKQYEKYVKLNKHELKIVNRKISDFYFWHLGCHSPLKKDKLTFMRNGLRFEPLSFKKWKSYIVAHIH